PHLDTDPLFRGEGRRIFRRRIQWILRGASSRDRRDGRERSGVAKAGTFEESRRDREAQASSKDVSEGERETPGGGRNRNGKSLRRSGIGRVVLAAFDGGNRAGQRPPLRVVGEIQCPR